MGISAPLLELVAAKRADSRAKMKAWRDIRGRYV
jgi:hypothetical protein